MVAPKKVREAEHDVTFAEGGSDHMFGKQSASPDTPGNTGKTQKAAPGAKFAEGGKGKMYGFNASQPAKSGQTGAR
jgi:hypothetical protein